LLHALPLPIGKPLSDGTPKPKRDDFEDSASSSDSNQTPLSPVTLLVTSSQQKCEEIIMDLLGRPEYTQYNDPDFLCSLAEERLSPESLCQIVEKLARKTYKSATEAKKQMSGVVRVVDGQADQFTQSQLGRVISDLCKLKSPPSNETINLYQQLTLQHLSDLSPDDIAAAALISRNDFLRRAAGQADWGDKVLSELSKRLTQPNSVQVFGSDTMLKLALAISAKHPRFCAECRTSPKMLCCTMATVHLLLRTLLKEPLTKC
jgi:hypothetical protein